MKVNLLVEVRTNGSLSNMDMLNEVLRALQRANVDGYIKSVRNTATGQAVGILTMDAED